MHTSRRLSRPWLAAVATGAAAGLVALQLGAAAPATASTSARTGAPPSAQAEPKNVVTLGTLTMENSFVSSKGWVKPGETYPSRILLTNTGAAAVANASVVVQGVRGMSFASAAPANGAGTATASPTQVVWTVPSIPAKAQVALILQSTASSLTADPQVEWRNVASNAVLTAGGANSAIARSHGPKVVPPGGSYDSARYGDRPFPIVPVEFTDRHYGYNPGGTTGTNSDKAPALQSKINDPATPGSTFNLYQEMSYGQLYPHGTIPALGKTEAYGVSATKAFTKLQPAGTCAAGATLGDTPQLLGTPALTNRVVDGRYELPGNTAYYGADKYGSAVVGASTPVGALFDIDSACGPTAKSVYDAAVVADPDIDYNDYDTDKDGVVDFFMMVFAGCGGNGGSQVTAVYCPDDVNNASYDNIWPHSSDLQETYSDPTTGLKGYVTQDQLKNLEGQPLWYTDTSYSKTTTTDMGAALKDFVRVGPYNVNPETAIDHASVISHEYGHSLGLPDFYSVGGSRDTYGDWTLMGEDKSQFMDIYSRTRLGWVVPDVLNSGQSFTTTMSDGKIDTQTIHWQQPDGTPYTLTSKGDVDQGIHNGQAYEAPLPKRQLIDESILTSAQGQRLWFSGSGNGFGCPPASGHNFDVALPGASTLPTGSTITATLDSAWEIEWGYDYGFVMAGSKSGNTVSYATLPSAKGYTETAQEDTAFSSAPTSCGATLHNGLTGTSTSAAAGTKTTDRQLGTYDPIQFVADQYDLSSLVGKASPVLRFAYSTDGGLAKKGWFIDNLKVTAKLPDGSTKVLYDPAGFEDPATGGPTSGQIYNGGCKESLTVANKCTQGWSYVSRGGTNAANHAYLLEMRDRSGFDNNGRGQNDRSAIGWSPGLYLAYTDDAHGDGNFGTDDPPAQSPLDSSPVPGDETPDLNDAAFTAAAAKSTYSDAKQADGYGRFDNYLDPSNPDVKRGSTTYTTPWNFAYDCLGFKVNSLSGTGSTDALPGETGADVLTGSVTYTMGTGCGTFDYGHTEAAAPVADLPEAPVVVLVPVAGVLVATMWALARRRRAAA